MVCAEPGNLFIEYEKKEDAEKAMEEMQGRNFDERKLSIYFIPTQIYIEHFKPNSVEKWMMNKNIIIILVIYEILFF